MLPKKLHIKTIERFHNRLDKIDQEIDAIKAIKGEDYNQYSPEIKEKMYKLTSEYYHMTKIWHKLDDFLEYGVDHKMDILKNEPQENWYRELKED